MVWLWLLVGGSGAAFGAQACSTTDAMCVGSVDQARRLVATLAEMPPSRLSCEVSNGEGDSVELVWDPLLRSPLTQTVVLPPTPHDVTWAWRVGCWSDAVRRDVRIRVDRGAGESKAGFLYEGDVDLGWKQSSRGGSPTAAESGDGLGVVYDGTTGSEGSFVRVRFDVPRLVYGQVGQVTDSGKGAGQTFVPSLVTDERVELLSIHRTRLNRIGGAEAPSLEVLYADAGGPGRSILTTAAPELVTDTIEILAEVALGRAKRGVADSVGDELHRAVCREVDKDNATEGAIQWLRNHDGPLLEHTCATVASMPLEELIGSASSVAEALQRDAMESTVEILMNSMAEVLPETLAGKVAAHLVRQSAPVLVEMVSGDSQSLLGQGELLVESLASFEWTPAQARTGKMDRLVGCSMELALSVAAACAEAGGCETSTVASRMRHPNEFFEVDDQCKVQFRDYTSTPFRAKFTPIAVSLTRAAAPAAGVSDRERARAAMGAYFETLVLLVEHSQGDLPPRSKTDRRQLNNLVTAIRHVQRMVDAMVREDRRQAVVEAAAVLQFYFDSAFEAAVEDLAAARRIAKVGARICGMDAAQLSDDDRRACEAVWKRYSRKWKKEARRRRGRALRAQKAIERAKPWVTVLSSHATALKVEHETQEEADAARTARVEAIEAVIDETTRRSNRDGQFVASLGGNPGVEWGTFQRAQAGVPEEDGKLLLPVDPQLRVPMGLSLQYLPDRRQRGRKSTRPAWVGAHTQLTLVDPSYLLTTADETEVSWNDFMVVGGQVGVIVGTPSIPFNFGYQGQCSLDKSDCSHGVYLSYYVPFLDFN